MSDEEIHKGLLVGDFYAQLAILDRYQNSIPGALRHRCPWLTSQEIDDIVVEVLYFIIQNPQRIDLAKGTGKMRGYILMSSYRKALDLRRKTLGNAEKYDNDEDSFENLPAKDEAEIPGEEVNTAASALNSDVQVALHDLVQDLGLSTQDIEHLRLRLEKKLSPQEIATDLGITPVNERVRWSRLLGKLKKRWPHYPALVEYSDTLNKERMAS